MNTKRWFIIIVAIAQVALLAYMAGEREWIARTGRLIALRTAPIDPNDPMRGQYVRLDYDISVVARDHCRDGIATWFDEPEPWRRTRDRVVYAVLDVGTDGLADLRSLTDIEPAEGVFLRGRVNSIDKHVIRVRYGIEAFFMEQGKARALEDAMRNDRRGLPLNMHAAVGANGVGVLRDYAWETLGLAITLERAERAEADGSGNEFTRRTQQDLRAVLVELKNHGEEPVAIVDRPLAGSFRLVRNERWGHTVWRWVGEEAPVAAARPQDVRVLAPGESHAVRIDLTDPKWFVVPEETGVEPKSPVSLGSLDQPWSASFRIEYVPPDADSAITLPHAELIQLRRLRSRAFTPMGGID